MSIIELNSDLEHVCRICLQDNESDMTSIYSRDVNETNLLVYEKIERCGGIKILNDPELPTHICNKCNAFLTMAHRFRMICKHSDNYIREYVCKDVKDGNDSTTLAEDAALEEYLLDYNGGEDDVLPTDNEAENEYEVDVSEVTAVETPYAEQWLGEAVPVEEHAEEEVEREILEVLQNDETHNQQSHLLEVATTADVRPRRTKTLDMNEDGSAVIRTRSITAATAKNVHVCDMCGNIYPRKYALEAHMRRHRNERPFECEICPMKFHLNFQLTRHIRKHTRDRPYSCKFCHRNFSDRSSMTKHERIHTNERPYVCEQCGKTFSYSSVLKAHRMTHTGEKPFCCNICDKRFSRDHHLRAHLETLMHQDDPRAAQQLKELRRIDNV